MGVDSSGGSFLTATTSEELQDQTATQNGVQTAVQNGHEPETDSRPLRQPGKGEMADGGKQAQGNFTKQAEKSKMKGTPDGVEQQAGSFTKQLYGYMPRFHRGAGQPPPHTKSQKRIYSMCLNLRDVGANMPALMKPGIVFRSSELLSADDMRKYGIGTILDLRRMDRPCKKKGKKIDRMRTIARIARKGPKRMWSERLKPYAARGQPHACSLCRERIKDKIGFEAKKVVHADLIPTMLGLRLFQAMPASVKGKAILAALSGKGAASVMAPAVANPLYMGYKVLYKNVLESSKRGIAKALRVFADKDNYPILLHCIHGKDRTGIIVMLILMLCGVESSIIVDDYMKSEAVLKASRMHHELDLDVYLTSDMVIAATKDTMEDTITHIDDKYGGCANYLHECGLEDWELSKIRVNLLQKADASDLLERLSMLQPLSSNHQSTERNKLQGLFSRNSHHRASLQRTVSQPDSDSLDTFDGGSRQRRNDLEPFPKALKSTVSAPPISLQERGLLHPMLDTAQEAPLKADDGKDLSSPALAEAGRSAEATGGAGTLDGNPELDPGKSEGMASAWAQLIDASTSRDISTGDIDKPEREAAHDPNKVPAVPKPAEKLNRQSNISLTELPCGPEEGPGHSLGTALKAGATPASSTNMQNVKSHSDTAIINSKALSPSGPGDAEHVARDLHQITGGSEPTGVPKAAEQDRARASLTAPEP